MSTVLWDDSFQPAIGGMAATGLLTDGAPGDSTTGVSASGAAEDVHVTAAHDYGAVVDVGGDWEATFQHVTGRPAPGGTWELDTSEDGVAWTGQDSGSFAGTIVQSRSGTLAPGTMARYVRLAITASCAVTGAAQTFYLYDFRTPEVGGGGCPDPGYTKELPRGTTREFSTDGDSPAPSVDLWEIWRCGALVDSGSGIGQEGLDGWKVADGVQLAYAITAPADALVTYGYQARIERYDGTIHVVNYNVIEWVTSAGAGIMPERPIVFEATRLGVENVAGTAVTPNRKMQSIGASVPTPIQPQQEIFQVGGLAAVEVVNQKGHGQSSLGGPISFEEMIWILSSLLETPTIVTPAGATNSRDIIFRPKQSGSDDAFKTFTAEIGSDDFAAQMAHALVTSGGLTLAGSGNSFDGQMIGRLVNEAATPTTGLTDIPLVPIAPGDNNHYVAASVAGLSAGILDRVLNAQITFGTRRSPLFVQKSADTSFSAVLAQRNAEMLASLELMHNSASVGYLTNLRNRDLLYYRFKNVGPEIETGYNYEFEVTMPFKFQQPSRGEQDNATMGGYNLRPIYKSDFEPTNDGIASNAGGFIEVRIRAPFTAFPAATDQ